MKATIDKNGILEIKAETELETYALDKWLKDNWPHYNNLSFDCSLAANVKEGDKPNKLKSYDTECSRTNFGVGS